ncbi:MAG: type II toxin-antitoxin system VapC family toxin [Chlamydiota bacterium]
MTYLLDTCILSKLRKLKIHPNHSLESWLKKHKTDAYYISVISLGEVQKGISKMKETEVHHKMILENWLISELIPFFENRILPIDVSTASIGGELCGLSEKKGKPLPVLDSLIAASAIQHQLILVTENIKDFLHIGVKLLNPCEVAK